MPLSLISMSASIMIDDSIISDFCEVLLQRRENITDVLAKNFTFNYLRDLFTQIQNKNSDKYVYRLLTGMYPNSKYTSSSVDWLPSEELVDSIIDLAKKCRIQHIEEIYTGLGILSSLLMKKTNSILVTAADTFECSSTCDKLNIVPIAKRSIDDYRYYPALNEMHPQMIIVTHYSNEKSSLSIRILNEMINIIKSKNHRVIIAIIPNTNTIFHDSLHNLAVDYMYQYRCYKIKAVDKYFDVYNLLKKYNVCPMNAYVLVDNSKNFDLKTDFDSTVLDSKIDLDSIADLNPAPVMKSNIDLDQIFGPAIIDSNNEQNLTMSRIFKPFYDSYSSKLVIDIYKNYDVYKPLKVQNKILEVCDTNGSLNNLKNYPQWIYCIDEFLFWAKCTRNNLFFNFDDRITFYDFYTKSLGVNRSNMRRDFPTWIVRIDQMYMYIYLDTIDYSGNWKINSRVFAKVSSTVNEKNKEHFKGKK